MKTNPSSEKSKVTIKKVGRGLYRIEVKGDDESEQDMAVTQEELKEIGRLILKIK